MVACARAVGTPPTSPARRPLAHTPQGFPDTDGPASVKQAAAASILADSNQYAPAAGLPELRVALADHATTYAGVPVDADRGVLVTAGATEALAAALLALVCPGDEARRARKGFGVVRAGKGGPYCQRTRSQQHPLRPPTPHTFLPHPPTPPITRCKVVLLDPAYDSYAPVIRAAGGVPVSLRLDEGTGWALPAEGEVWAAFRPGVTKALVLNTPHNPTGKVFAPPELALLAACVAACPGCVAVLDEVYEHLVHPGGAHASLAALPGMEGRCVRIGSAGKTFSLTGWKARGG